MRACGSPPRSPPRRRHSADAEAGRCSQPSRLVVARRDEHVVRQHVRDAQLRPRVAHLGRVLARLASRVVLADDGRGLLADLAQGPALDLLGGGGQPEELDREHATERHQGSFGTEEEGLGGGAGGREAVGLVVDDTDGDRGEGEGLRELRRDGEVGEVELLDARVLGEVDPQPVLAAGLRQAGPVGGDAARGVRGVRGVRG
eukprot:scaffold107390_cov59-Phaeocystis_antarctica.AAC.7